MKKKIRDLTNEEKLEIIDYSEIQTNFTKRNSNYKTYLFGNTFHLDYLWKTIFCKEKAKTFFYLPLCCGVARITIIDIMIAHNLLTYDDEIEVEEE